MEAALRAADFVDSIGVNTHLAYTDSGYARFAKALDALQYLGLDHIRDGAYKAMLTGPSAYAYFAKAGVKFDLVVGGKALPGDTVASIADFEAAHPGAVAAIEGPNEINRYPVSCQGKTGLAGAVALLDAVAAAAKGTPVLADVAIYDLTGAPWSDTLANDAADFANIHPYPKNGGQPMAWLSKAHRAPGKGLVFTEIGYYTGQSTASWKGVDEATQAKYTLNLLADATKLGVAHTYLYQLLDAYPDPSGSAVDKHLGLFDLEYRPKPAAVAIHNLTTLLADPAVNASSFTPHGLSYTLSGMPASGESLLIEKASGRDDIMIWAEPQIWNSRTGRPIRVAVRHPVLSFGDQHVDLEVFDPLVSDQPIASYVDVTSVKLSITDHPIIVEVTDHPTTDARIQSSENPATGTASPIAFAGAAAGFGSLAHATTQPTSVAPARPPQAISLAEPAP